MEQYPSQRRRTLRLRHSPHTNPSPPKRRRTDSRSSDAQGPSTQISASEDPDEHMKRPSKKARTNDVLPATSMLPETPPRDKKDFFPFMSLPAELRIHVYHMALVRDTPLLLHLPRSANASPNDEATSLPSPAFSRGRMTAFSSSRTTRAMLPVVTIRATRTEKEEQVPRLKDSINPALLRTCSLIYNEARPILYSENIFIVQLDSGFHSLDRLRQRTRSLIKSVSLTIPSHHDILDGFADLVRLGLRYCWGLKNLTITLPENFPDDRYMTGSTNIYANAFHILRWLPRGCKVSVEGGVNDMIRKVVEDEGRLMSALDEKSYQKRQHQMPERN